MSAPTVVKVLAPARLDPLEDCIRRIVALSDDSERMERWDFYQGAWVACPYDANAYVLGFILTEADRRTLGLPSAPQNGTARGGSDVTRASAMAIFRIIVARDQPELLARMQRVYADASGVEVCIDRRQGQRWTGPDASRDRRGPRSPHTDLHHRGFIVARASGSP